MLPDEVKPWLRQDFFEPFRMITESGESYTAHSRRLTYIGQGHNQLLLLPL